MPGESYREAKSGRVQFRSNTPKGYASPSRTPMDHSLKRSYTSHSDVGCFSSLRKLILPKFLRNDRHTKEGSSGAQTPSDVYSSSSSSGSSYKDETEKRPSYEEGEYRDVPSPQLTPFATFDSSHRLKQLRDLMKRLRLSAYIIPSEDEHQSEYTAPKDQRREFISGFTGSAGVAVVTLESAALSTDGRYFLQAGRQLDSNWQLLKQGVEGYQTWQEWVIDEVHLEIKDMVEDGLVPSSEVGTIAIDPRLISVGTGNSLKERCYDANINFSATMDTNLVNMVMELEDYTPAQDNSKLFLHELQYAGESTADKVQRVRSFMKEDRCFAVVVSALDEIAWLLNLRGNDVPYNPVFFSYVIITDDEMRVFVDRSKLTAEINEYLLGCTDNVRIMSYKNFWHELPALYSTSTEHQKVCLGNAPSYALYTTVPQVYEIELRSILTEFKGIKNATEIEGNRLAQLKDSIALCQTFAWLEEQLHSGNTLTEMDVGRKSEFFRAQQNNYKGLSFATIASTGPNSSVVHYEPTEEECDVVDPNNVFLMDSGAQFLEGTTDITRTYHFGRPSYFQKKLFTLVLSGHLNVAMLQFPPGTSSYYMDSLARKPLLKEGYNYSHGTGHGIDTYICVHSGPCGLSPSQTSYNYKPLEPGNFLSDEPGCYIDNNFGFRIESDVLVEQLQEKLLGFEYMTLVPFGLNLIEKSLLSEAQVAWVNSYHKHVRETISPYLQKDKLALQWLKKETEEI